MPRLLLGLFVSLVALPLRADDVPSFLNEIEPILTRAGCNQGSCHGKGAGQNGFRLSLRGYAPDQDWRWITRENDGRRIDRASPENSTLILKAAGQMGHEGGKVIDRDSPAYRGILAWIAGGAKGPGKEDPAIVRLTLTPSQKIMKPGEEQQITATAEFADGSKRDVTWLTKFDINDAGVASVSETGILKAERSGATAVRAAFLTEVAVATVTIPYAHAVDAKLFDGAAGLIDGPLFAKLRQLNIEPSGPSGDAEFIRRAFLDAIGSLPTADEVRGFLADASADKRAKLIDSLLERPEFVDYWTLFLGDLLQNRKERDHDVRGVKDVRQMQDWIRKQVEANTPWDKLVRDVLTAKGSGADAPQIGYYVVTVGEARHGEQSEAVASAAQAFLGTRIGCCKYHNHPLEKYTQDDYYHFAAFFSCVKLDRKDSKLGPTVLRVSHPDPKENMRRVGVSQPRTGQFIAPQPLDRSKPEVKPGGDPREALADWLTSADNEAFSGAIMNRVWKHFMGVGLVEPVDDLRATNPPSNPELWNALRADLVKHKFDLKHLMRAILNSRAYQLTSTTNPHNETDARFYSHYAARRLPAEVMADAVSRVTGKADKFDGYPEGMRAIQLPDPGVRSYFLGLFGRSDRVTACACERTEDVTMPQLLHLQNGENLVAKIRAADGRLSRLLAEVKDDSRLVEEVFLMSLNRLPSTREVASVKALLADGDPREEVFRDLLWAVLNSKAFAFNH